MIKHTSTLLVNEGARDSSSHVDILALANAKRSAVNARSFSRTWSCHVVTSPMCHGELIQDAIPVEND
jgi:hypothetical protein